MRFGYGVGIGCPPGRLEPLQITRTSTDVLNCGTMFVLHSCLLDEKESIGVVAGGTYVMTDTGSSYFPEPATSSFHRLRHTRAAP